jgi:hypothetical protein
LPIDTSWAFHYSVLLENLLFSVSYVDFFSEAIGNRKKRQG